MKAIRIALGCLCYGLAILCLVAMTMTATLLVFTVASALLHEWKLMLVSIGTGIIGFTMLLLGDAALKNLWQRQ